MNKLEIFGDSVLRGVMYSSEKNKYLLCDDNKFESFKNIDFDVSNNSRMGYTIENGLISIQKHIESIEPESTAILEFGGNDCDYKWKEISENPNGNFLPNIIKKDFIEKYKAAVDILRNKGVRVIISSITPIDAEKYVNWITRGLDYKAIVGWLGDISMLSRWQEYYNGLIEKVCEETGCELLDIRESFLTSRNFKDILCTDGVHPTQIGHNLIKKQISDYLMA